MPNHPAQRKLLVRGLHMAHLWPCSVSMEPLALIRRTLLGLLGTLIAVGALAWSSRGQEILTAVRRALSSMAGAGVLLLLPLLAMANELGAGAPGGRSGIVFHDAAETLASFCSNDAEGRLWLRLPGGQRFELVTTTSDPVIVNPGDGAFHTFSISEVQSALAGIRYPLDGVTADVFILPYPRRSGLESAAGPHLILLSPGVRPLSREHQHAELAHELGHVVQYARMADTDVAAWERYRRLRGIVDETQYHASSTHADRPHEIFAEDFRALFADALANYSGTIENSTLEPPSEVAGLPEFMRDLAGAPALAVRLSAIPNPTRGALTFSRAGSSGAPIDLFDAAGRRLSTLAPLATAGGARWSWDGRDATGSPVAPGVVFARERGAPDHSARITLRP